jgi:predicted Fe-S protein YdhL (DUF1289 family)
MDQVSGLCKGCHRTLQEIATWSRMSNQARWDIVQSLRERRRLADAQQGVVKHHEGRSE